jgi:hypothetical protein
MKTRYLSPVLLFGVFAVKAFHAVFLFSMALPAVSAVGACSGSVASDDTAEPDVYIPITTDEGGGGDGQSGPPLSTLVRIANLDDQRSIDFCVQAPGSDKFEGPLISPPPGVDDGGSEADAGESEAGEFDGGETDGIVVGYDSGRLDATADVAMPDAVMTDAPSFDAGDVDLTEPDAGSMDAAVPVGILGLAPFELSHYIGLKGAGTFAFAIVAAGDVSCDKPILTQLVTLNPGASTTVVFTNSAAAPGPSEGDGGGGKGKPVASLLSFTDEPGSTAMSARTRFIDVASAADQSALPAGISVGVLDSMANFSSLAAVVDPGSAASPSEKPPVVDALGYHDGGPMPDPLAFRIGPAFTLGALSWTSAALSLDLRASSVHTGFIVGEGPSAYRVLWCDDLSESSGVTDCTLVSQ